MSSSDINKICNDDGSSKSNDDGVCEVSDMLQNMSTADNEDNDILVCANCGKEGDDINNTCNKCKQVKYCNASCKKRHRHKHKIQCEEHVRLATEKHNEELRIAAELHDEKLFKEPPPLFEDCPICFVRMPTLSTGSRYQTCCGKVICNGCFYAPVFDNQGNEVENRKCAFCRVPTPLTHEEAVERDNKRMKDGHVDAHLIHSIGIDYRDGKNGFPQDYKKALELWHRAAEIMGSNKAYNNVGYAYNHGRGVEIDKKKAKYYFELAAMRGNVNARFSLGIEEDIIAGNYDRVLKHLMIAVRGGHAKPLEMIKQRCSEGYLTKDDYMKALQAYQEYLCEIKSDQRDRAAAADEDFKYYT